MTAYYPVAAFWHFPDAPGGSLTFYSSGTTTPKVVYSDQAGSVSLGNVVSLDSAGRPTNGGSPVNPFLGSGEYTCVIKKSDGSTLRTIDDISGAGIDVLTALALTTAGNGLDLVGLHLTGSNEVSLMAGLFMNRLTKGLKRNFGAKGDGVTDDYPAINAAFQASGCTIEIEPGTYLCNTAPTAPICAGIIGHGSEASKIQAGAGVLKILSLVGGTAPTHLRDFAILGNSTNNARGIIYGDGALTANIHAQRVAVRNYTGTGAIGEYIRDMVSLTLDMCQVSGNTVNRQIEAQTLQPTTIAIRGGVNELAVKQGMKVVSASGVTLSDEHIIQTNGEEGLLIAPNSSNVLSFKILGGWVEGNWYSLLADAVTRLTKFQVDATQVAASTIQLIVEHTKFDAVAKSIRLGAGNAGSTLRDVQVANLSGAIDCAGGYGRIGVPGNLDYSTVVNDPSRLYTNMYAVDTAYVAWTPTYASDLGNAATTFSGAITTALARAGNIGGTTIHATLSGSGTLNAVTPNYIKVSMPSGMTAANNATYSPALIKVGATYETGVVRAVGSDLYFYRANFANYTSAAAIEWNVSLMFEAAP